MIAVVKKMLGINVDWIKDIKSHADQQLFVDSLASSPIVDRLKDIVKERLRDKSIFKEVDYQNHSWAYHAADRNGYIRAMNDILKLLEIKTHDD